MTTGEEEANVVLENGYGFEMTDARYWGQTSVHSFIKYRTPQEVVKLNFFENDFIIIVSLFLYMFFLFIYFIIFFIIIVLFLLFFIRKY
jgi:hypothetical protein